MGITIEPLTKDERAYATNVLALHESSRSQVSYSVLVSLGLILVMLIIINGNRALINYVFSWRAFPILIVTFVLPWLAYFRSRKERIDRELQGRCHDPNWRSIYQKLKSIYETVQEFQPSLGEIERAVCHVGRPKTSNRN